MKKSFSSSNLRFLFGFILILFFIIIGFFIQDVLGYHVIALLLLLCVSILAMFLRIIPLLILAIISAISLNFFFITPRYTFRIYSAEDFLLFLVYFLIALVNAVLTNKIRNYEEKQQQEKEKTKIIQLYETLLNSLSHELRTPIATIVGSIDTIRDRNFNLPESDKEELLTEIQHASIRLNREVENLLNMSRLESGVIQPKLDWIDFNEVVYRTFREFEDASIQDRLFFYPDNENPPIKTDGGFLEIILKNLIHNAIKHNDPSTNVIVSNVINEEGLIFKVSDNGKGFPVSAIDQVFQKFYKIENTTGGTGIGLSLVKGFVESLNGSISLKNNKTNGAEFTVRIPVIISDIKS